MKLLLTVYKQKWAFKIKDLTIEKWNRNPSLYPHIQYNLYNIINVKP